MVALRADQAAEALTQLENGLGQLIIAKRISSARADGFEPCFQQRLIRHAERETRDDHVLKCVARDVDSLPEAVSAEQRGARVCFKLLKHLGAWQPLPLDIQP